MSVFRRSIVLVAAVMLLMRFAVPVGAAESSHAASPTSSASATVTAPSSAATSGDLAEFKAEMASALGPIMPMLQQLKSSGEASVTAQSEVQAQHVHPVESKPQVLILLKWLAVQWPNVAPMFSKLFQDTNSVPQEQRQPILDWARGQSPVVLPIVFKIVCAVGAGLPVEEHVIPQWVCNLLINTVPGLVQSFWPVIVGFAPTVLGLIGKFMPTILQFLINRLSAASAVSVSAASDVTAAHVHPDVTLPLVGELVRWVVSQLPVLKLLLLPALDQVSALDLFVADLLSITGWLAGQIATITPPIARLACIIGDDIIPALLCSVITLFLPLVSGFIQNLIGIVNAWIKNLPRWKATTSTTTTTVTSTTTTAVGGVTTTSVGSTTTTLLPTTTTTRSCFLGFICLSASGGGGSARGVGGVAAAGERSLAMQPVAMNAPQADAGSLLSFEFIAAALLAVVTFLGLLRRRMATVPG